MDFFDRVKSLCRASNTTIEAVAQSAGLSRNAYNAYRRKGNLPRADEAVFMARELHTTVEYLVSGVVCELPPRLSALQDAVQGLDEESFGIVSSLVLRLAPAGEKKRSAIVRTAV